MTGNTFLVSRISFDLPIDSVSRALLLHGTTSARLPFLPCWDSCDPLLGTGEWESETAGGDRRSCGYYYRLRRSDLRPSTCIQKHIL